MNKIIAAIDGLKFSESCAQYAIELAKQSHAHLVGVFLDDFTYHSYKIYELVGNEGVSESKHQLLEERDIDTRHEAVSRFGSMCSENGVNFSVHHNKSIALQELLHESIFADLLVIDRKETLTHYDENIPTRFIRDLLSNAQCPVLLSPSKFKPFEKVLFLYDGDPSSVYAVKMFNYLFPELRMLKKEVLSVKTNGKDLHLPNNKLMKEFMKRHVPDATYTVLNGVIEDEIVKYVQHLRQNVLVVLGAYQRSMVSRWFKPSMADNLMKELSHPLFVAHYK